MKFKKEIITIILVICILFTISAISAADSDIEAVGATDSSLEPVSNDTDIVTASSTDAGEESASANVMDENKLGMSNDVESLSSTDDGSFSALNTKINSATVGSTVYLENNYVYSSNDTISRINIPHSLTIDGQGHSIDAKGKSQIFQIYLDGDHDITLKNIIFLNGVSSQGGAVYWAPDGGNGNIINCTFINNTAKGQYGGGAVNVYAGVSNIINSTFINNSAAAYGGAIVDNVESTIVNCTFINNNVKVYPDYGTAVYLSGGAIYNSIFLNNSNICIYAPSAVINNNWFGNNIENPDTAPNVNGAVDNWYVLNFTLNGANNIASVSLNNLYENNDIKPSNTFALPSITFNVRGTNATLSRDTITLDKKGKASFGFNVTEDTGVLTVSSDGFSISKDVVCLSDDGTMAAFDAKIQQNLANGEVKLYNDYVYGNGENFITNTLNNGAINNGTGINVDFIIDGQGFTIDGNNKGRIIYFRNPNADLTLKNINFVNCNDKYGSAAYVTCKNLIIVNCTFTNCTATANPGAGVYSSVYGNYEITNTNFTNNKITANGRNGGAIAIYAYPTTVGKIINCSFIGNSVKYMGGAIFLSNGNGGDSLNISGCLFKDNNAQNASSMFLHSAGTKYLSNSIVLDENQVILSDVSFDMDNNWWGSVPDNYSTLKVNAQYGNQLEDIPVNKWLYLDLTVDDKKKIATISLNNLNDGTTYETHALPKITLNAQAVNATLKTNTITLDENGKATIPYEVTQKTGSITVSYDGIDLTRNIKLFVSDSFTALKEQINETDGATFSLEQNYNFDPQFDFNLGNGIEITKSITIDGQGYTVDAKGLKNIFYFNDDTKTHNLTLKNIIFTNAVSQTNGAAVYFKGNKLEIINCTFKNNNASENGDAVYVDGIGEASTINHCTFINNNGTGSVIYVNSDDVHFNVINSIFLNNTGLNIKATGSDVVAEYDWFGHDASNYNDIGIAKVDGVSNLDYLFLNITYASGIANISLNNLQNGKYSGYSLPDIKFDLVRKNMTGGVNSVLISGNGEVKLSTVLYAVSGSLTMNYNDFSYTKEIDFEDDGSFMSLYILITSLKGNTLNLERDYAYNPVEDSAFVSGIQLSKPIRINGSNKKIDAKGEACIFYVRENITFCNITFVNADAGSDDGGAIYNIRLSTFINCSFISNAADYGAAVYNWQGNCTFYKCTFINNTARCGAAVYSNNDKNVNLFEKCTFINNTAQNGGAINNYKGVTNFTDSVFINNRASSFGGAYYTAYYGHSMFDNCTFMNNSANGGAAIYTGHFQAYNDQIINSRFIGNKVTGNDPTATTYSVIFIQDTTVDRCVFINNTGSSGIIYSSEVSYDTIIKNSIFLNNTAKYIIHGSLPSKIIANYNWFGNTFDNYDETPNVVDGTTLNNWLYLDAKIRTNHADIYLNKLYVKSGSGDFSYNLPELTLNINSTTLNLERDNVTLDGNGKARVSYDDSDEGALTVSYEMVSLTKEYKFGEFDVLQDLINGGETLLELDSNYTYVIGKDTIVDGISIDKNITIDGKGHTTIDAKGMSKIFNVKANGVTIKNVKFVNSKSGAIYLSLDNTEPIEFHVVNCTFVNNTGVSSAVSIRANDGTYEIRDSTFINSSISGIGGALYLNTKNAEFSLYNSSFVANVAENGGALYIESDNSETTIDKCLFRGNNVTGDSLPTYGNAILWNTVNDNGNNYVKNSVFLDNKKDNKFSFVKSSGTVNINDNWWGNTAKYKPTTMDSTYFIEGVTPTSWLFINASVSQDNVRYNETSTIRYYLQVCDNGEVSDFDNTKLPLVEFAVNHNLGELSKDIVSLDEEFTYKATDLGNAVLIIKFNDPLGYYITLNGQCIIPKSENPFTMYANNESNKNQFIITANNLYNEISVECNDTSLIDLDVNGGRIRAKTTEGTAKLTFTYTGTTNYGFKTCDVIVNVVKVPLTINVTNIESKEITLNVYDRLDLNISFEIDEIHKGYAPAWDTMGVKYNSSVISFDYTNGTRYDNGSFYPTGHIRAKVGGTTNLTIYCTSGKFSFENYTIKITVNKIPTEIKVDDEGPISLKVDNNSAPVNAKFYINGTLNTTTPLTYTSNDTSIIEYSNNVIKANGAGNATLTVEFAGNTTHQKASKIITVNVSKYDTQTTVSDNDIELKVGEPSQIEKEVNATEYSSEDFTFSSSDESVATVNGTGSITAVGSGTATITVKYNGNRKYASSSATVQVTVIKNDTAITVTSDTTLNLTVNNVSNIVAKQNATNNADNLTYKSSDESVVTVDTNGNINAIKGGTAIITISYAGDGKKFNAAENVTVSVTVNKLPSIITVNDTFVLNVRNQTELNATLNHDNGTLLYLSCNEDIVKVDESGILTSDIGGTANVIVIFKENDYYLGAKKIVTVTVNRLPSIFIVEKPHIELNVGNSSVELESLARIDNVLEDFNYFSSNVTVVSFKEGKIIANANGSAQINISFDGNEHYLPNSTIITVNVNKIKSKITVENDNITLKVNENNKEIKADLDHEGDLTYEVVNQSVLKVENGKIVPIAGGKTQIIIKYNGTDKYEAADNVIVNVTVNKLPVEIEVVDSVDMKVGDEVNLNAIINPNGALTYESSNKSVLDVGNYGNITANANGTAVITVTFAGNGTHLNDSKKVTVVVSKISTSIIVNNSIVLNSTSEDINIGAELNITEKYELNYTSDNESVVTIDEDGWIHVVGGGKAVITIKFNETEKYLPSEAQVAITVNKLPSIIKVNDSFEFNVDDPVVLDAKLSHDGNLEYTISNTSVVSVEDGKLVALAKGDAVITISFNENEKYLGNSTNVTVTVNKVKSKINVENNNITLKVNETKEIKATLDHEGNLTYEVVNPSVLKVNETGVITPIIGGETKVLIKFEETGKFEGTSAEVTVKVDKLPVVINVADSIKLNVGDKVNLNAIMIPDGALIYNSSNSSIVSVENGIVTANANGTAVITVRFVGNETHLENSKEISVSVFKNRTSISVNKSIELNSTSADIAVGAKLNITDGKLNYASDNESVVTIDEDGWIHVVGGGKAVITIKFDETEKYLPSEAQVAITVNKLATSIDVKDSFVLNSTSEDFNVGAKLNITDGELNYTSDNESVVTVNKDGLIHVVGGGKAVITVTFNETEKYLPSKAQVAITVNKMPSIITVNDSFELNVEDEVDLDVKLSHDGDLTYTISNTSVVSVKDGKIIALAKGDAVITISFNETEKYLGNFTTVTVTVNKVKSKINVENDNITLKVNETEEINAILDHEGNLTYEVVNQSVLKVENGKIVPVVGGETKVLITFAETAKYEDASAEVTVKVDKLPVEIDMTDSLELKVGDNVNLNATVVPDAALIYTSSNSSVVSVENGIITAKENGTAIITVKFTDNGTHMENTKTVKITVNKVDIPENATEINVDIPEGTTAPVYSVSLPDDATGTVTVTVDGKDYSADVVEGKATVEIPELAVGEHNITVTYSGDGKYDPVTKKSVLDVPKANIPENATGISVDIPEGTTAPVYTVKLPADANGTVTVTVDGKDYTADVVNGFATVEIPELTVGKHDVSVTYSGDAKYNETSKKSVLDVPKANIPENATDINVDIPEGTTAPVYSVELPADANGTVTVTVDGKDYSADVVEGKATVEIPELAVGKHDVSVTYSGDAKYISITKNSTLDVPKADIKENDTKVNVDIPEGTTSPIYSVDLPSDASGKLTVTVDGKEYTADVVDGSATVEIPELTVGKHNVTVTYSGDAKYNAIAKKSTLDVPKVNITENATDIKVDVPEGTTAPVYTVKLPGDASGTVTVTVDGKDYSADVVNGTATVEVPELAVGKHNVTVTYSGDKKYLPVSKESTFDIHKANIPKNATILNVNVPATTKTPTFTFTLPKDANGNLTVTIGNKTYSVEVVNGSVVINTDELPAGDYNATIRYFGDSKYADIVNQTSVHIPLYVLSKNVNLIKIYSSNDQYYVRLTMDGKRLEGKKITFIINGKKYKRITNKKGFAFLKITLPPRKYTIIAKYGTLKVKNKVIVKHVVYAKNIKVKRSANKAIVKVALIKVNNKYLKNKNVYLNFNHRTYKAVTNKYGIAKFTINKHVYNKLKVGKKYTYNVRFAKDIVSKKITISR